LFRGQVRVRILEDHLELLPQAPDLDSLEPFLPEPVPDQDPGRDQCGDEREEGPPERREGLVPPDRGLVQARGIEVSGEDEADIQAHVEQDRRERRNDGRRPRRRPGRRNYPEERERESEGDAVIYIVTPGYVGLIVGAR